MNDPASFRDPAGVVFYENGVVKRRINACYMPQYRKLIGSGLYRELVAAGMLVPHRELPEESGPEELVIRPLRIPMISYPYEWSFGMLRDAALLTLRAHKTALRYGMCLKDASAYNIQFIAGRPLLIDTLSFEVYQEGEPWCAYGQFCRHFLAPLLLMCHTDLRLNQLLRVYLDGIPLDLADRLLNGKGGWTARVHIRWHARAVQKHGEEVREHCRKRVRLPMSRQIAMIGSLENAVSRLKLRKIVTEWGDYYSGTNYSAGAAAGKLECVRKLLAETGAGTVWDFGANDGRYTRLALSSGASLAVAFDMDPVAVERNYNTVRKSGEQILPLLLDLSNPSPSIGFANRERTALPARGTPDCILMLAVIHHLAISNNLPLPRIAEWLGGLTAFLIIEFVPKEDSQVQRLLRNRADVFPGYTQESFEREFSRFFQLRHRIALPESLRTLYLWERRPVPDEK
ncbi:MAG: hypothetical protein V8T90_10185 [Victivallales bacterium]